jgi:hypothetical protein
MYNVVVTVRFLCHRVHKYGLRINLSISSLFSLCRLIHLHMPHTFYLLACGLFHNVLSSLDCIGTKDGIINEDRGIIISAFTLRD